MYQKHKWHREAFLYGRNLPFIVLDVRIVTKIFELQSLCHSRLLRVSS